MVFFCKKKEIRRFDLLPVIPILTKTYSDKIAAIIFFNIYCDIFSGVYCDVSSDTGAIQVPISIP